MAKSSKRGLGSGIRHRPPNEQELEAVHELVDSIVPEKCDEARAAAKRKLDDAIARFRHAYIYAGAHLGPAPAVRYRGHIKNTRVTLKPIAEALDHLCKIGSEPDSSKRTVALEHAAVRAGASARSLQGDVDAMRRYGKLAGPLGRTLRLMERVASPACGREDPAWSDLRSIARAAQVAFEKAREAPNKSKNHAPVVLAAEVVGILRSLGVNAAISSDQASAGQRGGVCYARLFRASLNAAGASPPDELKTLLIKGRELADWIATV